MPPALQLPKTIAVADQTGNDGAADRAAYEAFLEATLRAELPTSRLPLERYTVDGGWPTNATFRIVATTLNAETLRLRLCVTFDELVTGCGGGGEERPRLADLTVVVDRKTATAVIVSDDDFSADDVSSDDDAT